MALFASCAAQRMQEKHPSDKRQQKQQYIADRITYTQGIKRVLPYKRKTTVSYLIIAFFFFSPPSYKHKTLGNAEVKVLIATLTLSSGIYYI